MITNVTMLSPDRNLAGTIIRQDTKTGFMCLSDLQEAYDKMRVMNGWGKKGVDDVLANNNIAERTYYILMKRGYLPEGKTFRDFMDEVEKDSLTKILKRYRAYRTVGARENRRTICDPYVWVLIAMEMNPMIYAEVVMWLTDKLILNRIEVGDKYNTLSRAAYRFPDVDYPLMAKALNYIVFGVHETALRNKASQKELKELETIQSNMAFAIEAGFITSFNALMDELRKAYMRKYPRAAIQKHPEGNATN